MRYRTRSYSFRTMQSMMLGMLSMWLIQCEPRKDGKAETLQSDASVGLAGGVGRNLSGPWEWRDPSPSGNHLWSVAFGRKVFVAVADGGCVFHSKDGKAWNRANIGTYHDLRHVLFAADRFVAVGDSGVIFISEDGVNWQAGKSEATECLRAVAYGNGRFFATGEDGAVRISTDGFSWETRDKAELASVRDVVFGGGVWVAGNYGKLLASTDAEEWKPVPLPDVLYGDGFLAERLLYSAGRFIAVGKRDAKSGAYGVILSSPDGFVWSKADSTLDAASWNSAAFVDSRHLLIGLPIWDSGWARVQSSRDGKQWTAVVSSDRLPGLAEFAFGKGIFVGVGGRNRIYTSKDGLSWNKAIPTVTRSGRSLYRGIAYGDFGFVASGTESRIFTSKDGKKWTEFFLGGYEEFQQVIRARGRYVVIGKSGSILHSREGNEWKRSRSDEGLQFMPALHAANRYVTVGEEGASFVSTDLIHWKRTSSKTVRNLNALAFGAGKIVVVGDNGTILASEDGEKWSRRSSGTGANLHGIAYADGQFKAVGYKGVILSSLDGITWGREISGTSNYLMGVAFGGGEFLAVGSAGILASRVVANKAGDSHAHAAGKGEEVDSIVGIWTRHRQDTFQVGSINASDSLVFSEPVIPEVPPAFVYPEAPRSAETVEAFIPEGWSVLARDSGDLNGDQTADVALVLQVRDSIPVTKDYVKVLKQPLEIRILFRNPENQGFTLAERCTTFIPDEIDDGYRDPFKSIAIRNGLLDINLWLFHSKGTFMIKDSHYGFRYLDRAFVLTEMATLTGNGDSSKPPAESKRDFSEDNGILLGEIRDAMFLK